MAPFLANLCSEVDLIWPLTSGEKIDIDEYVRENEYDYIFVAFYPGNINLSSMDFFK